MTRRQHSSLFREVNDRIYELLLDLPGEFRCECGSDCDHRAVLLPADFAGLRRAGRSIRSHECVDGVPVLS